MKTLHNAMLTLHLGVLLAAILPLTATRPAHAQDPEPTPDSLATASLPLEPTRTVSFTTDEGSWISVDISPDGATLVFDLLGDLYTLPVQGGTAAPLLTGPAFESQPRFSPDGSEIVFVSDRSGGQNLWVLSVDGSDTTQITRGNNNLYTSPAWSPDGEYLVASRTFSPLGGAAKPWLFHRDGGSGIALIDEPDNLKAIGPAFDPSGRYIYLAQGSRDWNYDAAFPQYQLIRYDRETGRQATVTGRYGSGFRPAVSPDGATLVYGSRHEDATGLRARDLATGDERWLVYPVQRDDMESRATLDILPGYTFTPRRHGPHRVVRRRSVARPSRRNRAGPDPLHRQRDDPRRPPSRLRLPGRGHADLPRAPDPRRGAVPGRQRDRLHRAWRPVCHGCRWG